MPKQLPRLRPSSSDRWLNCALSAHAKDGGTSEAAEEGTRLHSLAEDAVSECLNGTYPIAGTKPTHDDPDVQFAVDRVWELVREGSRVFLEAPVTMAAGDDLISGTADVVILQPDKTIDLLDYKFGVGIRVDANSDQLAIYAAGLLQMYREAGFSDVRVHIIQPRHHKGVWLDKYEHRRTHSAKIVARSIEAIEAIRRKDAPRSGDWCRWCPHKTECPAIAEDAFGAMEMLSQIVPPEPKDDLSLPITPGTPMTHEEYIDSMFESLGVSKQERKSIQAADGEFTVDTETGEVLESKPAERVQQAYNSVVPDFLDLLED